MGAQGGETVALSVKLAGVRLGLFGVQEVAILGHHQEYQAVDEAEEFVEPFGQIDLTRFQLGGKVGIGLKETGAEKFERDLDLKGQTLAGDFAFLGPGVAPAFQRAVGGRSARDAEAGAVDQQPENGERSGVFVGEYLGEVGLDISWSGQ